MDELVFPINFMCIGDKTFIWVYENRKEFVDFTVTKMDKPTGLFQQWQSYCNEQRKFEKEIKG